MAFAVVMLFVLSVPVVAVLARRVRHWHRGGRSANDERAAVTRQHMELLSGVPLPESSVEAAKVALRRALARGDYHSLANQLRPGLQYALQVQALAEIGTVNARLVLELQLQRRLSDDPTEQSWYWVDVARALRRAQASPEALLVHAERFAELPLRHLLAAEVVQFERFAEYLTSRSLDLMAASRLCLYLTLQGLRTGLPLTLLGRCRLGECLALMLAHDESCDALDALIYLEGVRLSRRGSTFEPFLSEANGDRRLFLQQIENLAELESEMLTQLQTLKQQLATKLVSMPPANQLRALQALYEMRADVADSLFTLLSLPEFRHREVAFELFAYSRDKRVGPALVAWWERLRGASGPVAEKSRLAVLRALRSHRTLSGEQLLTEIARSGSARERAAALGSLGWYDPLDESLVRRVPVEARYDDQPSVRIAARAALARLGERLALEEYRGVLESEPSPMVCDAIRQAAQQKLVWLWPDVDRLADAQDTELALVARESLEQMHEELFGLS
jgi:hypothetical protein